MKRIARPSVQSRLFAAALLICASSAGADSVSEYHMGPAGKANVKYPGWFKESFLDLAHDLAEARRAGKRGVILFVSAKNCNHCQALLDTTLSDAATSARVREGYEVIGLDVFSDLEFTDVDGATSSVAEFVTSQKARLTPTTWSTVQTMAKYFGRKPMMKLRSRAN